MDRIEFIVYIIGSFIGSTVLIKTSSLGRLELPSGEIIKLLFQEGKVWDTLDRVELCNLI